MDEPLSPPPTKGARQNELPAYVSNGVIGLRVRETALNAGLTLVSGYTGEHQVRRIEAAAVAPYPVAGDIQIAGVWMSDAPHQTVAVDQTYDFACGGLTSRFEFAACGVRARVQVITFCSRDLPSLVCQEIAVHLDGATSLGLKSIVDARHIDGRALRHFRETPGEADHACDGAALWESAGGQSTCGVAYVTELIVSNRAEPERPPLMNRTLSTGYAFRAHAAKRYRLRQMASVVPSAMHSQPDLEAVRQVALAAQFWNSTALGVARGSVIFESNRSVRAQAS